MFQGYPGEAGHSERHIGSPDIVSWLVLKHTILRTQT